MKKIASIELASDLGQYFQKRVEETARKQGLRLEPHLSAYLGKILERFSQTQNFLLKAQRAAIQGCPVEEVEDKLPTMALLWLESQSLDRSQQFFQMQSLGDFALFTAGYFADYVRGSAMDQDYYYAIGGKAYERAGQIRESISSEKALNTFFTLAEGIRDFAEIFSEVADSSMLNNDKDTLRLYEKWLDQKSARIGRMLAESGVIAADNSSRVRGPFD